LESTSQIYSTYICEIVPATRFSGSQDDYYFSFEIDEAQFLMFSTAL